GDAAAISRAGAIGLMQLMPHTAGTMYVEDPVDPAQNIMGGTRYIRWLANQFNGDMLLTLAAYNAGPEAVRKYGGVPPFDETRLRYKPRNQRARNLLGLSLFKVGELDRAEEIYRSLIEDHPSDPTLRVNLGLVFLKKNASADAVRCFETALDLASDHQKAQNYLGLALAQKGELGRAREWFLKAGNDAMADRMSQALQQSPIRCVAEGASEALTIEQPFTPAIEEEAAGKKGDTLETAKPAKPPRAAERANWVATTPGTAAAPPVAPEIARTARGRLVANGPEPSEPPAASAAEAEPSSTPPPSMSQYTSTKK